MVTIPYITVDDAQLYFDERLNTGAWDEASDDDRLKALKQATRLINNLNFIGQKLDNTQPNEFPRLGQPTTPDCIGDATCELALQLLDQVDPNLEIENIMAQSQGIATEKVSYARDFVLPQIKAGIVSSEAWLLLLPYLNNPSMIDFTRVS